MMAEAVGVLVSLPLCMGAGVLVPAELPRFKEVGHIWLWDHHLQPWRPTIPSLGHTRLPGLHFCKGKGPGGTQHWVSRIRATSSEPLWVLKSLTYCCLLPVVPKAALFLITWQVAGTVFYQNQCSSARNVVQLQLSKAYGKVQSHFCLLPCFYFNYNILRGEEGFPPNQCIYFSFEKAF